MENWFPSVQPVRWGTGSWLATWLARIFGKRVEGTDGRVTIIGYRWRGCIYIVGERSR